MNPADLDHDINMIRSPVYAWYPRNVYHNAINMDYNPVGSYPAMIKPVDQTQLHRTPDGVMAGFATLIVLFVMGMILMRGEK